LLDNVTIEGAAGVLINITGGMDLTIDEVTTIASIIQEAAGDETEIIFGAVHDPNLREEVRVTVIATGLDREEPAPQVVIRPNFVSGRTVVKAQAPAQVAMAASATVAARTTPTPVYAAEATPFQRTPQAPIVRQQLTDLDIPTFIRRQMD
jgi:cell division protein FtsZ